MPVAVFVGIKPDSNPSAVSAGVEVLKVKAQGSRAKFLMEPSSQDQFAPLERFRGQKVVVGTCGRQDNEMMLAVNTSMILLQARRWKVDVQNPHFACTTDMRVFVRYDSPEAVRSAAAALGKVLISLGLMPSTLKSFEVAPKPEGQVLPGWSPSSTDEVLLMVMVHP